MFNQVFLIAFSLVLFVANIYFFVNKKYLYLFVPCMLFLPPFYGVEFSINFPVLTVARMMFITLFIYAVINRKRSLHLKNINLKKLPKEYFFLLGYFLLRIFTNLHGSIITGQAIKTIFLILYEQLFLLIAFYLISPSKEEIKKIIKIVVWTASFLFIIGIIESIFEIRLFDALYTVTRDMNNIRYYRLGLLRINSSFTAPALFGNMCVFIFPLICYLYDTTKQNRYLFIVGLNALAVIHSGSRSDMFFYIIIAFVYMMYILEGNSRRILFIKNAALIVLVLLIYMSIVSIISPTLQYYYVGTGKSILNEVGFDYDLDEDAPSDSSGYGKNINGSISRTRQLTGILYVAKKNPIFGLGASAANRGKVQYYWHFPDGKDRWTISYVYDVGIVEIFCDEGIIGLLGMCALFAFMIIISYKNKYHMFYILCYLLGMLSTKNMYAFLMFYLIILLHYRDTESN
ncbi:MAG: O-antigen ligase family protein [Pseudobutyrivibrio sp.]|uniref:O-antigen ligase family protein n=1 Tax=Pseudobutyrivibrio sp. TaxID=2014367 RepID=UPI0025CC9E24|nr:O-antigen ligase family protein [Pseudobutyrivibrio sp.]MBQ8490518.1 O-antigen ligase family protein [Pseudobutyrivibrio sp.]